MATRTAPRKPRQTDEEREAKVNALKAELDAAVASLDNEEVWEDLLRTISQFGSKYSFGNQLLIMVQSAQRGFEPQLVMGFNAWKAKKRSVIKGQTGLKIWAPNFRFPTAEEIEKAAAAGRPLRIDPETNRPAKILAGYRIEHVFDVSQTEGEPVEIPAPIIETVRVKRSGPRPELLEGEDIEGAWAAVASIIESHGYRIERGPCMGANGFTDPALKLVKVRDDVSPAQAMKTLIHELAHIECSHVDDMAEYLLHRGRQETEAESVAYIVCGALGLDSGRYSAPYVRSWSEGKAEIITAAATMVVQAAGRILKGLEAAGLEASKRELVAA
jgi:antirestriction protein ArdC